MRYNGFKIAVFYRRRSWAEKWFEDFKNEIGTNCMKWIRKNPLSISLKYGTMITAYNIESSCRGYRIDKAYVEPCISDEVIQSVIRPMINSCIIVDND